MAITIGNIVIPTSMESQIYDIPSTPQITQQPPQPTYQSSGAPYNPRPTPKPTQTPFINNIPPQNNNIPTSTPPEQDLTLTQIEPEPEIRPPNLFEWIFPPLGFWNIIKEGGEIPTDQVAPDQNIITGGTPDEIADIINQTQPADGGGSNDQPDWINQIGNVADLTMKIIPLFIVIGLVGAVKKLF